MNGRIALAVAFVVTIAAPAVAGTTALSPTLSTTVTPRPAPVAPHPVPATMASDRVLGRADAPVTIIEYASFTCSHCADFTNNVVPQLKSRYIDTGQVKLVFRDLPTPPVQISATLAALARCSAPGKFFDVAEYLMAGQEAAFRTQDVNGWIRGAIPVSGRSEQDLLACMATEDMRTTLGADIDAAQASGINSTPSVFVNGRQVRDHTVEGLEAAIAPLIR